MSLLVGLIGALGVVNTITLNVLERTARDWGAALDGREQCEYCADVFDGRAGVWRGRLGDWGGAGVSAGADYYAVMEAVLFHLDYVFTWQMVLMSLGLALLLTGAASMIPALAAARMRVKDVLRYDRVRLSCNEYGEGEFAGRFNTNLRESI